MGILDTSLCSETVKIECMCTRVNTWLCELFARQCRCPNDKAMHNHNRSTSARFFSLRTAGPESDARVSVRTYKGMIAREYTPGHSYPMKSLREVSCLYFFLSLFAGSSC